MTKPVALVVDDEPDIRELLAITLRRMDVEVVTAIDVDSSKQRLQGGGIDICLTDMRLPDGSGLDLVEWMQTHAENVPVAMITAHGNIESAVQALKLGAFDFVSKPVELEQLRKLIQTALKLRGKSPGLAGSGGVVLLGDSPAMERVRLLITKVARSQAPVHICGESGTGKELVARLIHDSGPRAAGSFVPVNCGAIPAELMESEFFGHKKGSFTGAVADKLGLFRSAEGGTLFLDEIADLPLHMQVKLLRVIQEKAVRPVGEATEYPVDVRVLSATHKDLAVLVAEGSFREDLYYRVNVIELPVPPLRERGQDVLQLANHVLARLAVQMGLPGARLAADAKSLLQNYRFPGNVRELENILERALTLSADGVVVADDIQLRVAQADDTTRDETTPAAGDLGGRLDSVERDAIVRALEETRYNKTAAARLLGLTFRQLRYRIKKLGIE